MAGIFIIILILAMIGAVIYMTRNENNVVNPQKMPVLYMYISSCASNMLTNEVLYLREIDKYNTKFYSRKAGDFLLERITFIISYLSLHKIEIKDEWEEMWFNEISAKMPTSKHLTEKDIKLYFIERLSFYKEEIDVLNSLSMPLPNEIISQLYHPMVPGMISHNISPNNGFSMHENNIIWRIITSELNRLMSIIQKNKDFLYYSPKK